MLLLSLSSAVGQCGQPAVAMEGKPLCFLAFVFVVKLCDGAKHPPHIIIIVADDLVMKTYSLA